MDASPVLKCDCDPEVGFFCVHCAMENNYIQDLQNKLIALEAENAKYREALEYISKTDTRDPETEDFVIWLNHWRNDTKQIAREALKGME